MQTANCLFVVPPGERVPIAFVPPVAEPLVAPSQRYFAAAFALLPPAGLTVYLTWDLAELPSYGDDVVAVVVADEASRRPRYAGRVRCVFKCYGDRPRIGWPPAGPFALAADLRRWIESLPDLRIRGGRVEPAPLGYHNQVELPIVPIEQRATFAYFAGSVEEPHRSWLPSAKTSSRRRMLAAARRFTAAPTVLRTTPSFGASTEADPLAYSTELMNSVVCLCPRGGSVETFRWFEAMRAGCVVVCEPLPRFWFYSGAPAIELRDWDELPALLERLHGDPAELRRLHEASLAWWASGCGERALARRLAAVARIGDDG
ncbi:MAG TPA: hypothetical protein VFB41_11240 [Solirubrobacteraceae bacterium]|nr:hypothetical protein [Solirubrobacteraceae bacterium]